MDGARPSFGGPTDIGLNSMQDNAVKASSLHARSVYYGYLVGGVGKFSESVTSAKFQIPSYKYNWVKLEMTNKERIAVVFFTN